MNVPRHIRPLDSDDNFVPAFSNGAIIGGDDDHNARDQMIVPDRIIVAGGNEVVADKPPPPEIALDMKSFIPGRYTQNSVLETPPDKLTLHNRKFPSVDEEEEYYRQLQQRQMQNNIGNESKSDSFNEGKQMERQNYNDKINRQMSDLPPTSTMSVLSPSEELNLLRNHVRKLGTRLQKLEEEVQDTNRHVNYLEIIGGIFAAVIILKSVFSRFSSN